MARPRRRRTATLVVAVGLAAWAGIASCRGGSGGVTSGGSAASEVPSSTSSTAGGTSRSTSGRSSTTSRPTSTSKGSRPTSTTGTGKKPQVVVPQQGAQVVAVFVATGASLDEPAFSQAIARLKALGYPTYSGGDTGCSRGAKEALPQLGQYSVSVEFATRADAERFAALYGDVVGIAQVTVYCAD